MLDLSFLVYLGESYAPSILDTFAGQASIVSLKRAARTTRTASDEAGDEVYIATSSQNPLVRPPIVGLSDSPPLRSSLVARCSSVLRRLDATLVPPQRG